MSGEKLEKRREMPLYRELTKRGMVQPFLDGFLEADAMAREQMIDDTTRQLHLARQFCRFDKSIKLCKNERMKAMLERYKRETLKLMSR